MQTKHLRTSLLHLGLFEINCDSLCLTPKDTADTLRVLALYACSRLDPMETIGMRGVHRYGHLELIGTATSGDVLTAAGSGKRWR